MAAWHRTLVLPSISSQSDEEKKLKLTVKNGKKINILFVDVAQMH